MHPLNTPFPAQGLPGTIDLVVAIPARDEAVALPACLAALGQQQGAGAFAVVVSANNCRDDTIAVAAAIAPSLPFPLVVDGVTLPAERSTVGFARKAAMDRAAAALDGRGGAMLLATDADARPAPDWIARCRAHITAGCDAVAGHAVLAIDPDDPIPAAVLDRSAREARLLRLIDRCMALLEPASWDPWPRHCGHWGANFAVTRDAYRRSGGMPPVPLAEDRAFFDALHRMDARIRHADDVVVHVLARRHGRAPGGMADVLARRADGDDALCDAALIPVRQALLGARARSAMRRLAAGASAAACAGLARRLGIALPELAHIAQASGPGEAWFRLRARCRVLHPRRIPYGRLERETAQAESLVRRLSGAPPDVSCEPPFATLV